MISSKCGGRERVRGRGWINGGREEKWLKGGRKGDGRWKGDRKRGEDGRSERGE
jgi:hypothetical protein